MWLSGKSSWGGVCCVSMTKARFRRTSNQPPKVLDAREIALHEVGRKTRCEQIQWPDLYPTATDQSGRCRVINDSRLDVGECGDGR
jgi:hypothetical protein